MKLCEGDTILCEISRISNNRAYADSERWSNVSEVIVQPGVAITLLTLGKEMYGTVTQVEDGTAYLEQIQSQYSRHYRPGDIVELTADELLAHGVCSGEMGKMRNLSRLILQGANPGDRVNARIEKIRSGIGFLKAVEVIEEGIRVGEIVQARTHARSRTASLSSYPVSVSIDKFALIESKITIEITRISDSVIGTVIESDKLPAVGQEIIAKTVDGTMTAREKQYGYVVKIPRFAQIATEVALSLTSIEEEGVEAEIVDSGALPEVGAEISAETVAGTTTAREHSHGYTVEIPRYAQLSTEVTLQITSIEENEIKAEIIDSGSLPTEGAVVSGQTQDRAQRVSVDGKYNIEVDRYFTGNFEVSVAISRVDTDEIKGEIVDEPSLPCSGDRVTARTQVGSNVVLVRDGDYEITMPRVFMTKTSVEVEITEITEGVAFGTLVGENEVLSVGQEIDGKTVQGTKKVTFGSDGIIRTDTVASVETTVSVRIMEISEKVVHAELSRTGNLPIKGEVVEAIATAESDTAKPIDGSYRINLDSPALVSGYCKVQLTNLGEDAETTGEIKRYANTVPKAGDRVKANISWKEKTAYPLREKYKVNLRGNIPKVKTATVEIENISDRVYGKIKDYEERRPGSITEETKNRGMKTSRF